MVATWGKQQTSMARLEKSASSDAHSLLASSTMCEIPSPSLPGFWMTASKSRVPLRPDFGCRPRNLEPRLIQIRSFLSFVRSLFFRLFFFFLSFAYCMYIYIYGLLKTAPVGTPGCSLPLSCCNLGPQVQAEVVLRIFTMHLLHLSLQALLLSAHWLEWVLVFSSSSFDSFVFSSIYLRAFGHTIYLRAFGRLPPAPFLSELTADACHMSFASCYLSPVTCHL